MATDGRTEADRLVDGYLRAVVRQCGRWVGAEVAAHVAEARPRLPSDTPEEISALLERVGRPADIAEEERTATPADARVPLLLLVAWPVGAVRLWRSPTWRLRDRLAGTLLVPGGLAGAILACWAEAATLMG